MDARAQSLNEGRHQFRCGFKSNRHQAGGLRQNFHTASISETPGMQFRANRADFGGEHRDLQHDSMLVVEHLLPCAPNVRGSSNNRKPPENRLKGSPIFVEAFRHPGDTDVERKFVP